MRIYDEDKRVSLDSILIMLTPAEVHELIGRLESLSEEYDHFHQNDMTFKREITIGLYTSNNMHSFHKDIVQLLEEDD